MLPTRLLIGNDSPASLPRAQKNILAGHRLDTGWQGRRDWL